MCQERKSAIFKDIEIAAMAFERKSFVSLLLSFVSQRLRRYNAFQFLRVLYIANLANFQHIEMGPTAFERELFVLVCISPTFVCTSKDSKIQRFQNFGNMPRDKILINIYK